MSTVVVKDTTKENGVQFSYDDNIAIGIPAGGVFTNQSQIRRVDNKYYYEFKPEAPRPIMGLDINWCNADIGEDRKIDTTEELFNWLIAVEKLAKESADLSNYLLNNKVDKVTGKGLSTEDYTTTEKTKLSGIETGAEVNVQSNWNETDSSSDAYIQNKPTNVSTFANDAGYLTQHQDISGKADKSEMSVTQGTGANADKTTIQLKSGTSAAVLNAHQQLKTINNESITGSGNITIVTDISGKADKTDVGDKANLTTTNKSTLVAAINEVDSSTGKLNSILVGNTSIEDFDESTTYGTGVSQVHYCYYNDLLYVANTTHTGAWNDAHFDQVSILEEAVPVYENVLIEVKNYADDEPIENVNVTVQVENEQNARVLTTNAEGKCSTTVLRGWVYTVTFPHIDNYIDPESVARQATVAQRTISGVYRRIEDLISTITIDQRLTVDGVAKTQIDITGDIATGEGRTSSNNVIQWIRENSHCYVTKYNSTTGKLDVAQLSDTNKGVYAVDDSAAPITTVGNDVFMKLPEFYYKCEVHKENNTPVEDVIDLSFALRRIDNTWQKWDDKWFIGVYEAYISNNKMYSVSGVVPTGSVTTTNFDTYVANRNTDEGSGAKYNRISYSSHKIMCLLAYAWYGEVNIQNICGFGADSYSRTAGALNSLGMKDTDVSTGNTSNTNFWGIDNWWGDKTEWMAGVTTIDTVGTLRVIDGNLNITKDIRSGVPAQNTYCTSKMYFGEDADVIPIARANNTNYNTYYCDGGTVGPSAGLVTYRSSNSAVSPYGGVGCLNVNNAASGAGASIGSRLEYRGDYNEVDKLS